MGNIIVILKRKKKNTLQHLKLGKLKFGIRKIGCSMSWTRYMSRPLKTSSSWKTIWWLAKYKHIFPWKWKNSIEDFLFWLRFQFDAAAAAPAQACRSWCCRGCHASPPNFGRLVTQYTLSYLLREQDVISEQEGKFSQNS